MTTTKTARAEVFRAAAADIRANGLGKGWFETTFAQHCTVGALIAARDVDVRAIFAGTVSPDGTGDLSVYLQQVEAEVELLAELLGTRLDNYDDFGFFLAVVYRWNDLPERTAEEAADLLDRAAEAAEAIETLITEARKPVSV